MLKNINYLSFTVILILAVSCEVPYDIPVSNSDVEYVVDGLISDNPGPYTVTLTYSAAYTHESEGTNLPVEGANVTITDDTGLIELLSPVGQGKYMTGFNFTGIPNRTYILHIQTVNGDELMSNPELMPLSSTIAGNSYEHVPADPFHPDGYKVKIMVADNPGQENYYRWTFSGVYQFSTPVIGFALWPTHCWQFEYFPFNIILANDQFVDGNTFEHDITIIPYFSSSPYLLTVYQHSLTKESYNFWKLVNDQINHSSGIFGVQPARIKGNMFCVNNPDKNVLGYFGASSIITYPVFVKREDGIVQNRRIYETNSDCTLYSHAVIFDPDQSTWPYGWPR